MNKLIGFYSPAPQSGKSFAANVLAQNEYRLMSFAEPIKRMAVEFFISLGYSRDEAIALAWAHKEKIVPEINATPRHVLQTLGTQWGRDCINQSIWLNCMKYRIEKEKRWGVVIDDVRFQNEAETIKELGGEMWKIIRPSVINKETHISEGGLDDWNGFDRIIENTGTIHEFRAKLDALMTC